ncbi:HMG box protein [Purpureocillium lavendulum]|uniref:HMG box protein n=1 Tax=Purpureocillium lavendulum TaxID=1247861 RepID=A0AB34G0R9_9HYPO|nr:HMG box protein [Purpureocillium lavendulum]
MFATGQTGSGAEQVAQLDEASASDGSLSESPINQHQCVPSERDTRTSGRDGQNDLINRVTTAARASYPYTIEGKTATLKEEISGATIPEHAQRKTALQELFQELSPQDIEDLHRTIFENEVGLNRRDLPAVWQQVWDALQSSRAYALEEELQLPRTSCIFVDIDTDGDLVVSVKIGRLKGLRLCADWKLLTHLRYM